MSEVGTMAVPVHVRDWYRERVSEYDNDGTVGTRFGRQVLNFFFTSFGRISAAWEVFSRFAKDAGRTPL